MNFISLAVSVFISNYIFMIIIKILPFIRRKKLWQGIIISLADISSILTYVGILITSIIEKYEIPVLLEIIGNILGVLIGYIAIMMIILDGISLFKSKRLKEFERGLNQKDGRSLPKNVISLICLSISIVLLVFSVITIINYNNNTVLPTLIGALVSFILFLGLSIYFFISGKPLHQTIQANNLLLYIKLPDTSLVYQQELTKELTIEKALGKFQETYMLDEFGLIITPNTKYVVKGIMVTKLSKEVLNELNMNLLNPNPFEEAFYHFRKYSRKKIVLDNDNKITKVIDLK